MIPGWDISLAGMIGGLGFGLFCVCMVDLWRHGRVCQCQHEERVSEDRPGDDDIHRIIEWLRDRIDEAVRANDIRWIRRTLK